MKKLLSNLENIIAFIPGCVALYWIYEPVFKLALWWFSMYKLIFLFLGAALVMGLVMGIIIKAATYFSK